MIPKRQGKGREVEREVEREVGESDGAPCQQYPSAPAPQRCHKLSRVQLGKSHPAGRAGGRKEGWEGKGWEGGSEEWGGGSEGWEGGSEGWEKGSRGLQIKGKDDTIHRAVIGLQVGNRSKRDMNPEP